MLDDVKGKNFAKPMASLVSCATETALRLLAKRIQSLHARTVLCARVLEGLA
jgi:hypothetical protein